MVIWWTHEDYPYPAARLDSSIVRVKLTIEKANFVADHDFIALSHDFFWIDIKTGRIAFEELVREARLKVFHCERKNEEQNYNELTFIVFLLYSGFL